MINGDDISGPSVAVLMAFSFAMGIKHAVEPDHLAAVSTIVANRKSLWSSLIVGGLWGVGHTLAILIAGVAVIAFNFQIGERLAAILECGVGLMLVALGVDTLRKVLNGGTVHSHLHRHGPVVHAHPHAHSQRQAHARTGTSRTHHGLGLSPRPIVVGIVHGFAGSGALMLLILPTITSSTVAFAYLSIFGIGSIGGMILMSTVIGLPFHYTHARRATFAATWRSCAGLLSLALGVTSLATMLPELFR